MQQLTATDIEGILQKANLFIKNKGPRVPFFLPGQEFICNFFLEPSTRTKFSFEVAQRRLGFEVLNFSGATSSITKGETLYDSLKTLESVGCRTAVVRLKQENILADIAESLDLNIINAGEGTVEHPSQCLLDLLSIQQRFSKFEGLKIAIVGDTRHSRVFGSHSYALPLMGFDCYICGPESMQAEHPKFKQVKLDEILPDLDIVMFLRIQKERHLNSLNIDEQEYFRSYGLTTERYKVLKERAILMHPGPFQRDVEIASELIESDKSIIFQQKANGVFARMAILDWIVNYEN